MSKNLIMKLVVAACLTCLQSVSSGQCETYTFLDNCATSLGTFNYIKSFDITAAPRKKAQPEFSYVFSKGSTYMLILCEDLLVQGKMVINLYDRNHNLIASTYDETTKKHYPKLVYSCSATGVYYIKASFTDSKKGCGMCILGFDKV
jgi:hypothetical protein